MPDGFIPRDCCLFKQALLDKKKSFDITFLYHSTGLMMALIHEMMVYWSLSRAVNTPVRELCSIILVKECLIMLLKVGALNFSPVIP